MNENVALQEPQPFLRCFSDTPASRPPSCHIPLSLGNNKRLYPSPDAAVRHAPDRRFAPPGWFHRKNARGKPDIGKTLVLF